MRDGDLFDFPCSQTFREYGAWMEGETLPPLEPPPPMNIEERGNDSLKERIDLSIGMAVYTQHRLSEHLRKSKIRKYDYY